MLYHVGDVDLGLAEDRVLRPGGVLVAVTNGEEHLAEAGAVGGVDMRGRSPFSRENAEPQLRRQFAAVERHDVDGTVTFAGHADVRRYVESLGILRGRPADVQAFEGPLEGHAAGVDLRSPPMIRPADVIERKRNGEELPPDEIRELVLGYGRGDIGYQLAAFCMAVWFRGLSAAETLAMTEAIIESGETVDLAGALGRKVVDKHSTGGVGDKTSIAVAPIVAACGVPFGKMSGRGLGHTGGTLDKLESIPGFRVELTLDEFVAGPRRRRRNHRPDRRPRACR